MLPLSPDLLLSAYTIGLFPMARDRYDPAIDWIEPHRRGILPLDDFHIPRSLKKHLRRNLFEVTADRAFARVIEACAEPSDGRLRTWLNDELIALYTELHRRGHAHSVECWQDGRLVGGLYGVSIHGAFFGESMFSRVSESSKTALVYLVARLRAGGYLLLDTQFTTDHLNQFGALEISREHYRLLLREAVNAKATFNPPPPAILAQLPAGVSGFGGDGGTSTT